jgi:cellulose synthase/poly-beta-1,6-N-acetylglucosamine synthase-like glycosyltransferase
MAEPKVSVIVPACNAAPYIARCLQALGPGSSSDHEVIVVDDASIDDTPALAAAAGARVIRLPTNGGPSRARNAGAREARGEYLFFVDADVIVHESAMDQARAFLDDHADVAAVFGSYDAQPPAKGLITQYRNLLHHFIHQTGQRDASTFWSGCGAIRRRVFLAAGGFDERNFPRCIEDIELGYRLRRAGQSIALDPTLLCTHLKRWTLISMVKTDVCCRALPWARLNRAHGSGPDDLNIKQSQKLSVLLTGMALLAVPLACFSLWALAVAGAALVAIVALNWGLFSFFMRTRGPWFALRCVPLHLLYFLYSGASLALFQLAALFGVELKDGNTAR